MLKEALALRLPAPPGSCPVGPFSNPLPIGINLKSQYAIILWMIYFVIKNSPSRITNVGLVKPAHANRDRQVNLLCDTGGRHDRQQDLPTISTLLKIYLKIQRVSRQAESRPVLTWMNNENMYFTSIGRTHRFYTILNSNHCLLC